MTETVLDDTLKNVLCGDPDGPLKFIDSLGQQVPTYIDPREDLVTPKARGKFKRLDYHVPFNMRNEFKFSQWPEQYRRRNDNARKDIEDFVLCHGFSKSTATICAARAVNRSHFCRNHGGALHPADKKVHVDTLGVQNLPERVEQMTRVQKFMQGFLKVDELEDDEIQGSFVRDTDGRAVPVKNLAFKFEQMIAKELHARLNRFLQSKASSMLHVMVDIAENDINEAADRIKAAQWVAERTIGRTPEVIVHGTTDKPYESILAGIESGSREDRRQARKVGSSRVDADGGYSDEEILDVDTEEIQPYERLIANSDGSFLQAGTSEDYGSDETEVVESTSTLSSVEAIEAERKRRVDASARIKRAKQKRFAARAVGAKSLDNHPWLLDFRKIKGRSGFRVKLVAPDAQTPALIEKIQSQFETPEEIERRVAGESQREADNEVLRLQNKLAKMTGERHG